MQIHSSLIFIVFFFAGFVLSSCKEEADDQIPIILITTPFEGQEFNIPDVISIDAMITNDRNLTSLQVGLVNSQFISVIPAVYLFPESSGYHVELELPVTDPGIETGNYYLYIRAEDEYNFKNEYQSIHITGVPKKLEKIVVVTYKDASQVGISTIDAESNVEHVADIATDYASSEIDSKYRQLYIAGVNLTDMTAYNFDTEEIEWQRAASPPLPVHSNDCFYFDEYLYVSYSSYYIYGFRYNGSMVFNTTIEMDKQPSVIMKFQDYIIADLQSKTGGYNYIVTYYLVSGVEKQRMPSTYQVVDFYDAGNNEVLIIANENDEGTLRLFNPEDNTETVLKLIPDKIICSAQFSESEFILGTSGTNYLFSSYQLELTEILPGTQVFTFRFDPIGHQIFACGTNQVYIITYPELEIQNAITISDGILNLHLFYNR